jgi:hypothetical protein
VDYFKLFENVRKRPGMYFIEESYDVAAAFVLGCDAGNDWGLLIGFREWLILRLDGFNNLAWSGLVLEIAFPGESSSSPRLKQPCGHHHAIETLFDLLAAFLAERNKRDGLREIFEKYEAWLQQQSWSNKSSLFDKE